MMYGMDRLGPLLHGAARAMRKRFEYRMREMGLSSAQWRLLVNLARQERMTQAGLADLLDVEPISVSRLVDRMEAAGWVARETDPRDRRVRLIVPTPKARLAHEDIRAIADEVYDEALNGLSATERDTLVKGLSAISANLSGLSLAALSLWMMTGFSPQMGRWPVITSGVVQGLGLGLVFVPLSTVAFGTLDPKFRADATSLFSLVRNIGSSIGISIVTVALSRNLQINHAELGATVTPYNPILGRMAPAAAAGDPAAPTGLDGLVNMQALMVSYLGDFKLMMIVCLSALPLTLLLRKPMPRPSGASR